MHAYMPKIPSSLFPLQENGDEQSPNTASITSRFSIDNLIGDISILSGKTVLFCEEHNLVRKVFAEEMENWGMQVTSASEERQGIHESLQVSYHFLDEPFCYYLKRTLKKRRFICVCLHIFFPNSESSTL